MGQETGQAPKPKAKPAAAKPKAAAKPAASKPAAAEGTKRVVLKAVRAIMLPEDVTAVDEKKLREALGLKAGVTIDTGPAWLVIGEFEGSDKATAIKAYAGEPGTPDAKVGDYRAPGVTAWKGMARYKAPPKPLVERELLD